MLSHAEQYAVTHFNATDFRMSVLSSRTELIAYYERRGYARTGEVKAYPISAGVGLPLVEGLQVEALVKRSTDSQFFLSARDM
ncbi:MAG: family N-acetyltransferase [Herbaspirillum sp.]|nr:family N-acetyltransferase [Herbaspirillum sp.]